MRVRKIAKQLKKFHANVTFDEEGYPVCNYKVANLVAKTHYILRMTRKHYFGLRSKYPVGSMMWQLYTHKACAYDLYDEVLSFWGWREQ
jgi:hypothetical protein